MTVRGSIIYQPQVKYIKFGKDKSRDVRSILILCQILNVNIFKFQKRIMHYIINIMYYVYGVKWKIVKIVISILVSRKTFKNVKKKSRINENYFDGKMSLIPPLTVVK